MMTIATTMLYAQDLTFNPDKYEIQQYTQDGKTFSVRAYEGIVYVKNPIEPQYQQMNIYIPVEYFEGKMLNGFSAQTAPIFFPNQVGGYMPASPSVLNPKAPVKERMGNTLPQNANAPHQIPSSLAGNGNKNASIPMALSKGYVVASAGARGRTSSTGKAPAVIIDLKSAVRYLKFNDKIMAGDAQKIISNGTSAGGAVSALLGASADSPLYEKYLAEIGAAEASDAIFAVSAYCPITNLENADMAYEWQFNGIDDYKKIEMSMLDYNVQRKEVAGTLTNEEKQLSKLLKNQFPKYVNSLKLKGISLDKNGNGSLKNLIKSFVIASANKAMNNGVDMTSYHFLTIKNGKVSDLDWSAYIRYMERMKLPPAFDGVDLSRGENQLFGDDNTDKKHFTEFSMKNTTQQGKMADKNIVNLMNPMPFILKKEFANNLPKYWRIRHGSKDRDTSLAIPILLGEALKQRGYEVDLSLPWDKGHSGDYDLEELFQWIEQIIKDE